VAQEPPLARHALSPELPERRLAAAPEAQATPPQPGVVAAAGSTETTAARRGKLMLMLA
jgi:hypothetical protein